MSERVVISAAHCFSVNTNYVHTVDVKTFKVAAGKYKRELDAEETLETQIRDVVEVRISRRYDGNDKWKADIATILIAGYFEYRPHIVPACLKFEDTDAEKYPKALTLALVAGWGATKVGL